MTPAVRIIAWLSTAIVVFFTLGPLGYRPQFGHPVAERFFAFFFLGIVWNGSYPRRWRTILLVLTLLAAALELAQFLTPGRDPRLADGVAKILGLAAAAAVTLLAKLGSEGSVSARLIGPRPSSR